MAIKTTQQQKLYDLYRSSPPERRHNSIASAYHNGLLGWPFRTAKCHRDSIGYAAWKAGHDTMKERKKAR